MEHKWSCGRTAGTGDAGAALPFQRLWTHSQKTVVKANPSTEMKDVKKGCGCDEKDDNVPEEVKLTKLHINSTLRDTALP